jgi:hypothetical protein
MKFVVEPVARKRAEPTTHNRLDPTTQGGSSLFKGLINMETCT